MKRYAEQMRSHNHPSEHQIFYDRQKIQSDLAAFCKQNIRKRAFPAIYDFQQEN